MSDTRIAGGLNDAQLDEWSAAAGRWYMRRTALSDGDMRDLAETISKNLAESCLGVISEPYRTKVVTRPKTLLAALWLALAEAIEASQ